MTDTINIPRAELQAALDAMQDVWVFVNSREKIKQPEGSEWYREKIETLRARLAQQEGEWVGDKEYWEYQKQQEEKPEPVAWMCPDDPERETAFSWKSGACVDCGKQRIPVYTTPPQREWQGLTDEEVVKRANSEYDPENFARGVAWASARLEEKNS